jgi:hypothetical protein
MYRNETPFLQQRGLGMAGTVSNNLPAARLNTGTAQSLFEPTRDS